ncbi:hypothetical protein CA264_01775 [Pontibacter actiniarum]|uniref:Uncharacterized protein n=2 Tax=Pontibacter actiniarum TaxID=323450 RepID=A0A1X9YXJ8_9BACT|nr:hypothetical protein CA264_01775 [Pontibacter actiniarum]
MRDEDAEYRNVRSTGSNVNYGGGPVAGYDASSYRGASDSNDHYHYGDPNPYMSNRRSGGGYRSSRGTGWEDHDNYGTTGTSRGTNYSAGSSDSDRYSRQDNSYRYSGQGRRYDDFNRDEDNKSYRGRSDRGYNMLGTDAYYDRGDQPRSRWENDYDRDNRRSMYEGRSDRDDYSDRGEIRRTDRGNSGRDENYATGLYANNRSYVSDNNDYSERSSRYRRPGETSGPDYGANSGISSYGNETPRA